MGRHTAVYLAGILIGRLASFVMLPFYTRYLTPADYGIMQLLEMTLDIISILAGARIASGIERYYFKAETERERQGVLSTAFAILAMSFVAFGLITGMLATPLTKLVLGSTEAANLMRIASVTFALQSFIIVPFAIVQLQGRSLLLTTFSTIKLVVQLTLNIVLLATFHLGVQGVFISTLAANALLGGIATFLVMRKIPLQMSGPAARALLRYGLPLVGTQFATFFITYGDRYFLRVQSDVAAVGLYGLAYQFGFIVATVGNAPFAMMWGPTRFQLATQPDRDAVYSRAFVFMNVLMLSAAVACALFVRDFIVVMADPAYHTAYRIVPVILLAYVLQSWAYFHDIGILVRERTEYVTLANWIGAVVALLGYMILIPRWLGWGAAIATAAAFLVRWIMIYGISQKLMRVRYDWAPVWRLVGVSVAFVLVGVALPHPSVKFSLVVRAILMVAYGWLVWNLGIILPNEKQRIRVAVRSPRALLVSLGG